MGSLTFLSISAGSVVRNLATVEGSWVDFSLEFILGFGGGGGWMSR